MVDSIELPRDALAAGQTSAGERLRLILHLQAERNPDAVAVYEPDGSALTFAAMQAVVDELRKSVPADARVALHLPNRWWFIPAMHAVWQRSSTAVLVSHLAPEAECRRRMDETGCTALIRLVDDALAVTTHAPAEGPPVRDHGEAMIVFTSGTTGRPKGAVITFDAMVASVGAIAAGTGVAADGRPHTLPPRRPTPIFSPMTHMAGSLAMSTAWNAGRPILICPRFSADLAFEIVERFDLDILRLTPAMVYDLAFAPGDRQLPLKSVTSGTAPLPLTTKDLFEQRYGVPVLNTYGSTEFAGAIAFERYEDVKAGRRPRGSTGRVADGVEVKVLLADGSPAELGEVGEIVARSASMLTRYAGGDRLAGDWFHTGDLGTLDADGFVSLVGRIKDMLICGGFNVYPSVVEAALNKVTGVRESAVAGLADDRLGEVPAAAVLWDPAAPRLSDEELRAQLREELAPYEVPRRFIAVEQIPRGPTGKVDRPGVAALFD